MASCCKGGALSVSCVVDCAEAPALGGDEIGILAALGRMRREAPQPVHKQTPEEFWDRIAQIEQHDPIGKRFRPRPPETHVDRVVMESFADRQRGDKLLGRYPNADHPDIGAQERSGWATYVYISEPHTMADCPFGEDGRRKDV